MMRKNECELNILTDAEISIEEVRLPHAPIGSIDIVTLGGWSASLLFFFAVNAKIYWMRCYPIMRRGSTLSAAPTIHYEH